MHSINLRHKWCQPAVVIVMIASLVSGLGCRAKIAVHTTGTPTAAKDKVKTKAPVIVPDLVAGKGNKSFFQTRNTITLDVHQAVIGVAPSFTLLNVTKSNGDDSKGVVVFQQATPNLGLSSDGTWAMSLTGDGQHRVIFYPLAKAWAGKFFYGLNNLKILVPDPAEPRYATAQLTLHDFDVFDINPMSFPSANESEPVTGGGLYEGWLSPFGAPAVDADSNGPFLTEGGMNIINGL